MAKLLNCIVPGCKSSRHYTLSDDAADSVTFFSFPKKPYRRKVWINALERGYWKPQKSSRICMLHFKESEIIRGKPGRPLKFPTLTRSAVPSIFPSLPKPNSLTQNVFIKTEELEDNVSDFENFCENFETKLQLDRWYFLKTADNVILYLVKENETTICSFKVRISVCSDFFVRVFLKNSELSSKDLNWILPFDKKLTLWSQLNCIMSHYETIPEEQDISEQNFSVDNKKIKLIKEDTNETLPEELDIYEQNTSVDNKKIKLIKADTDQTISDQEISNGGITNQFICDEVVSNKTIKNELILDQKVPLTFSVDLK